MIYHNDIRDLIEYWDKGYEKQLRVFDISYRGGMDGHSFTFILFGFGITING